MRATSREYQFNLLFAVRTGYAPALDNAVLRQLLKLGG